MDYGIIYVILRLYRKRHHLIRLYKSSFPYTLYDKPDASGGRSVYHLGKYSQFAILNLGLVILAIMYTVHDVCR